MTSFTSYGPFSWKANLLTPSLADDPNPIVSIPLVGPSEHRFNIQPSMNFTCTDLCTFLYHARLLRYHSDLIRVGCHTLRSLKLFLRTNSINDFLGKIPMKREEYMRLMELNQRLKGCHEDVETSHDRNCEEAKYSENCPYENRVFNTIPCSQLMSSIHL